MPSLLLLGTVAGSLNDVMYASIATNTDTMRSRSKFVQDGVMNSKLLTCVEGPSSDDPFHTLNVMWRYYSQSEPRDYTCIEATGLIPNDYGELVGFHLVHSLEFSQLPVFRNNGVERANMSVCAFFRQKTTTLVECYCRGYFDFQSTNDMLNNISLHTVSTQWLSIARYVECAQMKKLVWWIRVRTGRDSFASSSQSSSSTSSGAIMTGGPLNICRADMSSLLRRERSKVSAVLVAAAVLATSADGLQVVPNSAPAVALRATARYPPHVEGMDTRLLVTEAIKDPPTKTPSDYEFSTLEENEYEDDEEEETEEDSLADDEGRAKKKKKTKKNKESEETPTPTPTPDGNSTYNSTDTPALTPRPTLEPTKPIDRVVSWLKKIF
ncbi:hypothetical protein JM18_005724 [Phytophthora kernoviae]|uniref:Uncharacterized protein n=1 Tax=Phytophthora kernoviae TaxID=325452 RepID=A0A921V732_9STRA|nr:hypothetical protein JM18_005724 [Phytophthora kernoviae]